MNTSSSRALLRRTTKHFIHLSQHHQPTFIPFPTLAHYSANTPTTNNNTTTTTAAAAQDAQQQPTEPTEPTPSTTTTSTTSDDTIFTEENIFAQPNNKNRKVLKHKPSSKAAFAHSQRILSAGISITVPPMRLVEKITLPGKKAHELTPEDIEELEKQQHKNRMKEAMGYIPDGYEYEKEPQAIPEFVERRKKNREELERLLTREDVDEEFKNKIREVLELEDMIKRYVEEENPQNMSDPRREPRIPGVDYDKWSMASGEDGAPAKNEPLSNWERKFQGKTSSYTDPASYSQIIGITIATCIASLVTLGLAKPGFDEYIVQPLYEMMGWKKEGKKNDDGIIR